MRDRLVLWVAQGFGLGKLPIAPGTFGSLLGLAWSALLFRMGGWTWFIAAVAASVVGSVLASAVAETRLREKDPGSVVIDEIVAMPICFIAWAIILHFQTGHFPGPATFFSFENCKWTVALLVAFRIFDIAKPWPIRASQSLPGGWGVTVDDLLAALYVNICVVLAYLVAR
jgi:phosphatidylglycerophosphatase A